LHRAKINGPDATATILTLAQGGSPGRILDIGCGRGTTTLGLTRHHPGSRVIAIDRSPALLHVVRQRVAAGGRRVSVVAADFHQLPLPDQAADLAVAAFCLYHSPAPTVAVTEIVRCLRPGGQLVAVTKSTDSYQHLGHLLADAGLDPAASERPSLYRAFHTGNAADILTAAGVNLVRRVNELHTFRFADLLHLAAYLATCPQYQLPARLRCDPGALAAVLARRLPDASVTTTSTVTYLVAQVPVS
jgi:SAM-dependent methyltransferase